MTAAAAPPAGPSGGQLIAPADAQAVRRRADVVRAEALLSVARGTLTVWDVLRQASVPAGKPLLRLSLRQLLLAQPGVGLKISFTRTRALFALLGVPMDPSAPSATVQWLIDPRANGRRVLALIDVMGVRTGPPWAGFPFASQVSADASVNGGSI
jgi:hypothetical protein